MTRLRTLLLLLALMAVLLTGACMSGGGDEDDEDEEGDDEGYYPNPVVALASPSRGVELARRYERVPSASSRRA